MEIRFQNSPQETAGMDTKDLRQHFLIQQLMADDQVNLVYSHYERMIIGGARPVHSSLTLETHPELRADYFLERREIGIINVGGEGRVEADGEIYSLSKLDCLYAGKGIQAIIFKSKDAADPAVYYLLSAPAHQNYPVKKLAKEEPRPFSTGNQPTLNKEPIYKYIFAGGIQSAQLVMGLTLLAEGSVWNTM